MPSFSWKQATLWIPDETSPPKYPRRSHRLLRRLRDDRCDSLLDNSQQLVHSHAVQQQRQHFIHAEPSLIALLISVQMARYQPTRKAEMCWSVDPRFGECHRTTALVLLDETNTGIGRLYAVRRLQEKHRFVLREDSDFLKRRIFVEHPAKLLAALRAVRCRVD